MGRRANGEGSIFKDKRGLWIAEFVAPDGRKVRKASKKQHIVRQWLQQNLANVQSGAYVNSSLVTFEEFANRFMKDVGKMTLRETTIDSYERMLRKHIFPGVGKLRLNQIQPLDLQNLYRTKLDEGLSERSVEYIHVIINWILGQAVRWNMLGRNPASSTIPPKPQKPDHHLLTREQVQKLLVMAQGHPHFPIYCIAIGCGLRQGEILGLRIKDFDLQNNVIRVEQAAVSLHGKAYISKPKSQASIRTVGMPDWVKDAVKDLLNGEPDTLVFKTSDGGPLTRSMVSHHFRRVLDKAELPAVSFHSLRHLNITMLLAANVPPKDVQVHAGHSSFGVTMDIYGHVMLEAEQKAADKLDGMFKV